MNLRALLATAAAALVASACTPGTMSTTPRTDGVTTGQRAVSAISVANDAAPGPLVVFPNALNGGSFPSSTTAYVSFPAFSSVDRTLTITSSNPAVANPIASSVTIPAGQDRANVQVTASAVASETHATITVSGGGVSQSADVGVFPQGAKLPAPLLKSIVASPQSVPAGTNGNVIVTLSAPAPAGGLTLAMFAGPSDWADVEPPTATVPAGATSINVPVTTFAGFPNSTTTVNVQANAGVVGVETGLNVVAGSSTTTTTPPAATPTPAPPPSSTTTLSSPALASPAADAQFAPGTTVTFDWSDVTGAASYTLQVSTTDKFTSFVVNQTVAPSAYATSALPASTLFWRVRANGASTGAWSAVRRFQVK